MKQSKIVPMEACHVPQIAALEEICFSDPWNEASVRSELENPLSLWLAAVEEDRVLGYIGSESVTTLVLCFVQYLPAGLCLAWTYTKADNIFAPIVVHALVNAIAIGAVR